MAAKHSIEASDIMPMPEYAQARGEWRKRMTEMKRRRRVPVGPYVTFYFENWRTMWHQIQEMLFIEKGGDAQLPDELAAYNPMVPQGDELTATFMIEIDDPIRRKQVLGRLGGIEETAFLRFAGHTVTGAPEQDQDRTTAEGKASSVQFVHFRFTPEQIAAFRAPGTELVLVLGHAQYGHMAMVPEDVRAELAADFD